MAKGMQFQSKNWRNFKFYTILIVYQSQFSNINYQNFSFIQDFVLLDEDDDRHVEDEVEEIVSENEKTFQRKIY